jgi:thymidine kinase
MDFLSNSNSIDIIIGPMFSGKTTELIRRLTICAQAGMKVLVINSNLDTRSEEVLSCHSIKKVTFDSLLTVETRKVKNLSEVSDIVKDFDVIGIDEAQFFSDLIQVVVFCSDILNKKVIVCGLNGDFEQKPFGDILNLIPFCDTITKLSSFCQTCSERKKSIIPALFSKRIDTEKKDTIVIGNSHQYIPVCRKCFNEEKYTK